MRISDWSSYVCSSDLLRAPADNRSRVEAAGLVPTRDAPVDIGVRTQRVSGSDRGRPFPSVDALVERSHGTEAGDRQGGGLLVVHGLGLVGVTQADFDLELLAHHPLARPEYGIAFGTAVGDGLAEIVVAGSDRKSVE